MGNSVVKEMSKKMLEKNGPLESVFRACIETLRRLDHFRMPIHPNSDEVVIFFRVSLADHGAHRGLALAGNRGLFKVQVSGIAFQARFLDDMPLTHRFIYVGRIIRRFFFGRTFAFRRFLTLAPFLPEC